MVEKSDKPKDTQYAIRIRKRDQEKLYYQKVLCTLKDEFDRVAPNKDYTAEMPHPNVVYFKRIFRDIGDSWSNIPSEHLVTAINHGKGYREIELRECGFLDKVNEEGEHIHKNSLPYPDFTYTTNMVRTLMLKILEFFGIRSEVSIELQDYKAGNNITSDKDLCPRRTNCNLELWNEIRLVEAGQSSVSMKDLAKKYSVSQGLITSYRYYWARCIECGDIVIFDSNHYKKMVGDKEKYVCRRCYS